MSKELVNGCVRDINEYLANVSRSNNESARKHELPIQWMQVRIAALVSLEDYISAHKGTYGWDVDKEDLPTGTTHMLLAGIQHWDSDQPEVLCCMSGVIFWARQCKDGTLDMEDVDDCLGGGPDLQDSSMDECLDWMRGLGADSPTIYYDLVTDDGVKIELPDSGYSE